DEVAEPLLPHEPPRGADEARAAGEVELAAERGGLRGRRRQLDTVRDERHLPRPQTAALDEPTTKRLRDDNESVHAPAAQPVGGAIGGSPERAHLEPLGG